MWCMWSLFPDYMGMPGEYIILCQMWRTGETMIQTDNVPVKVAQGLRKQAEEDIRGILDRFEKDTGCMVCDIGHWHRKGNVGVARVELRVTL